MRVRKMVGSNNDFPFGGGLNDYYVDQVEVVEQLIETRLGLQVGDVFYNILEGTDYDTQVLGAHTEATRDLEIQDRILSTPGVSVNGITSYSSVRDPLTRILTQSGTVDTIFSSDTGSTTATFSESV